MLLTISLLLLILIGAVLWCLAKDRADERWALFSTQLVAALACESFAFYWSFQGWPNQWMYNAYFTAEFALLFGFAGPDRGGNRALLGGVLYLGLQLFEALLRGGYDRFCNYTYLSGALVLTGLYLHRCYTLAARSDGPVLSVPRAWAYLSIVTWFGASIPFNGVLNYLVAHELPLAVKLYSINEMLALMRYGLVFIAGCVALTRAYRPS